MSRERTLIEEYASTPEGMKSLQQERVILETTILISRLMKRQKITKAELARRLGKSKGYITQLLDGRTNMTLRTISDVMHALGRSLQVSTSPLSIFSTPHGRAWEKEQRKKDAC
jgi:transcriptional regulator with XRE-family HTH domain